MAASTAGPATVRAKRRVGDAVLQADDDGILRRMLRDGVRDLGGIGALDGHQHHAGIARIVRVF